MAGNATTNAVVNTTTQGDIRLTGNHTIVQWAHDVLAGLGLPTTPINIAILVTWANHESSGYKPNVAGGRNNPLNTTQPGHGGTDGGAQGNIKDYPSYADGVAAIVENLRNPRFGYPAILAGLRAQSPAQTFAAIANSSFGTHNLGPNTPLTSSGIPGVNTGTDTPSGGAGQQAQTVSWLDTVEGAALKTALGPVGPLIGLVPGLGQGVKAVKGLDAFIGLVLNAFLNWRYIAELFAGMALIVVGGLIIMHDVSGVKVAQVAPAVAKAAAA